MPRSIPVTSGQPAGCVRALCAVAPRAAEEALPSAVTIADLPNCCLLHILSSLPIHARQCAACVCSRWCDLLGTPSAWRDVFFDSEADAALRMTPELLAAVCARSAGCLTRLSLPEGCTSLRPTVLLDIVRVNPHLRELSALALRLPWSGTLLKQALELAPNMRLEVDAFLVEGTPPGSSVALESSTDVDSSGGALVRSLATHRVTCRFLHVAGRLWLRSLAALAAALAGGARVRSLNLAFADVDDDGARVLSPGIGSLYELNLRANGIRFAGCAALASRLAGSLRRLCLASNPIGRNGAIALGLALPSCALEVLDVSGCSIDTEGCVVLANGVASSKTLLELLIGFNRLGPAGAAALAIALTAPTSQLVTLDLEWTSAGPAGAEAIGRALLQRDMRAMQRIDLSSNGVTAPAIVPLAAALGSSVLHTLVLTNNARLGNGGAAALAAGLIGQPNAVLARLELGACGIRTAGALALARVLASPATHLCALNLAENAIGVEGVNALTNALRDNRMLVELSLSIANESPDAPNRATEVTLVRTPGRRPGPWRGQVNAHALP